jgi:hypothetical protein
VATETIGGPEDSRLWTTAYDYFFFSFFQNDLFYLIILITITLASSNNTLPDDGD